MPWLTVLLSHITIWQVLFFCFSDDTPHRTSLKEQQTWASGRILTQISTFHCLVRLLILAPNDITRPFLFFLVHISDPESNFTPVTLVLSISVCERRVTVYTARVATQDATQLIFTVPPSGERAPVWLSDFWMVTCWLNWAANREHSATVHHCQTLLATAPCLPKISTQPAHILVSSCTLSVSVVNGL